MVVDKNYETHPISNEEMAKLLEDKLGDITEEEHVRLRKLMTLYLDTFMVQKRVRNESAPTDKEVHEILERFVKAVKEARENNE